METETVLWILMLLGWFLLGIFARANANKKKEIRQIWEAHRAALEKEFHNSFRAGWSAASTDPTAVKTAYNNIFKNPDRN